MRASSLFPWEQLLRCAPAGAQPMVDVTFPFIILLGGLIVGLVTARVRGHTGGRKAADILVAAICGPIATSSWVSVVPRLFARTPDEPFTGREWAFFLADVLWFSPVIGGFIGVAAVAIGYRFAGGKPRRPRESWCEKLGAALQIVGGVYAKTTPEFWLNLQMAHDLSKAEAAMPANRRSHAGRKPVATT